MSLATDPLPANPSALRIFAAGLQAELGRKDIEIAANAASSAAGFDPRWYEPPTGDCRQRFLGGSGFDSAELGVIQGTEF